MNTQEWRENEEALRLYFKVAPTISIRKTQPRCPECGSADFDAAYGCLTAHGKFPLAA